MTLISLIEKKDLTEIEQLIKKHFPYTQANFDKVVSRFGKNNVFIYKIYSPAGLIGFIDLEIRSEQGNDFGFLTAIAVKDEFRRKGHAKKLVKFAIDFFKNHNVNEIKLIVKSRNQPAKKLYKELGFIKQRILSKKIDGCLIDEFSMQISGKQIFIAA